MADYEEDIDLIAELLTLRGRLFALEILVEMLWADRLAQSDNPEADAKNLKTEILRLIRPAEDDQEDDPEGEIVASSAHEALEARIDAVIERVRTL